MPLIHACPTGVPFDVESLFAIDPQVDECKRLSRELNAISGVNTKDFLDIVIVEDNEDEARMTILALQRIKPSPSVLIVADGEQAVAKLTGDLQPRPRLVLLDLKVPKVHGLDVLAALKSHPNSQNIPVVIFTSSDHPTDLERAAILGCDEYLCKPVEWEDYLDLVSNKAAFYLNMPSASNPSA